MFWILRLGKTFRELMADMNFGQWVERIYGENDFGRGIATSIAGSAGLAAYLYWGDWVIAAFVGIIIFPIGRILASAIHSRWIRSQERSDN